MSINYIDDNGVRQIFSDIKSNLDSINNTAVSAYDRANEAYSIASEGSITPNTQIFNIEGNKTFNISNGCFNIMTNNSSTRSSFVLTPSNLEIQVKNIVTGVYSRLYLSYNRVELYTVGTKSVGLTMLNTGLFISDGSRYYGPVNGANCI